MNIDQFVPVFSTNDGISNNALELSQIIRQQGHQSEIYTYGAKIVNGVKRSYLFQDSKDKALILHMSMGSPYFNSLPQKAYKILFYHGITPAKFFAKYNPTYYVSMKKGKEQLSLMKNQIRMVLATSEFTKIELEKLGYENISIVPPVYDFSSLNNSSENFELKRQLSKHVNIIFIGRISPHKCQHDLIKAFYFFKKYFSQDAQLHLIGSWSGMEKYKKELDTMISGLSLQDSVNFFIPGVEAMFFGLPHLAYLHSGALPETCGEGAVYFDEKDPLRVAEIINALLSDTKIIERIKNDQKEKFQKFSVSSFESQVKEIIKKIEEGIQN